MISFVGINLTKIYNLLNSLGGTLTEKISSCKVRFLSKYTTLIKQPRFGNLSKSLPIVNMKMSSPDSDLAKIQRFIRDLTVKSRRG